MQKNRNKILIGIIILGLIAFLGFQKTGLHFEGLRLVKGGSITIDAEFPNAKVLLDNKIVGIDNLANVAPGLHSIIIYDDTKWPWKKDVEVFSNENVTISPFLVSKNVSGEIITANDPTYRTIRVKVLNEQIPTTESPLLSKSNLVEIWSDKNNIFARWNGDEDNVPHFFCNDKKECSTLVKVLKSESEVRNIDFYKERDDILLIASQNGVFAIEIDKRGNTQNFQPVYKGTAQPRFVVEDEDSINVLDGVLLFSVSI